MEQVLLVRGFNELFTSKTKNIIFILDTIDFY